ncbi:NADAR family protein [Candidatus Parcubacteria bacterium]|nr:NADAR family protein [Candidatus Parcubacteria bacterium]
MYPDGDQNLNYETDTAVYFFTSAFEPLNNWSAHQVKLWGKNFPTVEHAFHYRKFSDAEPQVAEQILLAPSPWATVQIERVHRGSRRPDWQSVKVDIMTEIVTAKAAQNQDVHDCLLKTGNKTIIENSPWDSFWGIGPDGQGQNQMGRILTKIRSELA